MGSTELFDDVPATGALTVIFDESIVTVAEAPITPPVAEFAPVEVTGALTMRVETFAVTAVALPTTPPVAEFAPVEFTGALTVTLDDAIVTSAAPTTPPVAELSPVEVTGALAVTLDDAIVTVDALPTTPPVSAISPVEVTGALTVRIDMPFESGATRTELAWPTTPPVEELSPVEVTDPVMVVVPLRVMVSVGAGDGARPNGSNVGLDGGVVADPISPPVWVVPEIAAVDEVFVRMTVPAVDPMRPPVAPPDWLSTLPVRETLVTETTPEAVDATAPTETGAEEELGSGAGTAILALMVTFEIVAPLTRDSKSELVSPAIEKLPPSKEPANGPIGTHVESRLIFAICE